MTEPNVRANTPQTAFAWAGVRRGFVGAQPLAVAVLVYGITFGLLAFSTGLFVVDATLMSVFVYSGSAQTVAVSAGPRNALPLDHRHCVGRRYWQLDPRAARTCARLFARRLLSRHDGWHGPLESDHLARACCSHCCASCRSPRTRRLGDCLRRPRRCRGRLLAAWRRCGAG